jgi:4-diphosphocytidyl-2-C-methyl-D-erythritol kinase
MMRLRLHAPAKVNLGLKVVGRRADGYHLLDTVFHALDLHDTLWLEDAPALALEVVGDGGGLPVPVGDDNLVLRAARSLLRLAEMPPTGRFRLLKRIPAGGGLGGGSSDAAAALLLLQHRHGRPLGGELLSAVALELGADVPFFLRAGTQRATGIGEVLTPIDPAPSGWFVLVVPPFGTSTAAVFKNYRAELTHAQPLVTVLRDKPAAGKELWVASGLSERWINDLEASAQQLYPDLAHLRAAVIAAGVPLVSMSGSGSTFFAAFADRAEAEAAMHRVQGVTLPGVRVLLTRTADGMVASRTPIVDVT